MKSLLKSEFVLIIILLIVLIGLNAVGSPNLPGPLVLLRLLLTLVFIVLVPGYALQSALFPKDGDLSGPERLTLSICLSLGLMPILALVLNYLPWGIDQWPIVVAETVCVLLFCSIAAVRQANYRNANPASSLSTFNLITWWSHQDRRSRLLLILITLLFSLTSLAMLGFGLLPDPGNEFTEFYMLGSERSAEGFPQTAKIGQDLSVTLGLVNHERQAQTYRIEVMVQDIRNQAHLQQVATAGPFNLEPDGMLEQTMNWQMPWAGDDQQVQFNLFQGTATEPYRTLLLWIDVDNVWE